MRLFDTHCHFETADAAEIAQILRRAAEAGVESVMAVGGSEALNETAAMAAQLNGGGIPRVLLARGYDRDQIGKELPPIGNDLPLAAWGEIGLDYHYSPETRESQCRFFAEQLEEARRRNLPAVIHTREADDDTLAILREVPSRGIIHSYTGSAEFAKQLLDLGFYISFSGIATFRAAENVRIAARAVPNDRILIETDSPYLAPVPMRGNANEPAFVVHTCRFLAKEREMWADDFSELTYANAERVLFGLCHNRQNVI